MAEGKIVAEKQGHLGRVIFDNVEKHNAMSKPMWDALAEAMQNYDADDDVRVIVLEGAGEKAFVSGADISKFEDERANVDRIKEYGVEWLSLRDTAIDALDVADYSLHFRSPNAL